MSKKNEITSTSKGEDMARRTEIKDYINEIPISVDQETSIYEFPKLIAQNRNGKSRYFKIKVYTFTSTKEPSSASQDYLPGIVDGEYRKQKDLPEGSKAKIISESGIEGGKNSKSEKIVDKGTNIGKKNEKSVLMKALVDAFHKYKLMIDKGYSNGEDNAPDYMIPSQLPQLYTDKTILDWRGYIGPKLNGINAMVCFINNEVIMYTRGKTILRGLKHIKNELFSFYNNYAKKHNIDGIYLNGEIYKHGVPLQKISGDLRNENEELVTDYEFHIFNMYNPKSPDLPYFARWDMLLQMIGSSKYKYVKLIDNIVVNPKGTKDEVVKEKVMNIYSQYLENGYEGAVFWKYEGKYEPSYLKYKSSQVFKIKPRQSGEYKIIGFKEGKGKDVGAVIFICETDTGKKFNVRPAMTIEKRKVLYTKLTYDKSIRDEYLNNPYTITFSELSDLGVPQQPVGQALRIGPNAV
jgi:hypothetical protein